MLLFIVACCDVGGWYRSVLLLSLRFVVIVACCGCCLCCLFSFVLLVICGVFVVLLPS